MEIITYVHWTEPGEKDKFIKCIKATSDDTSLRNKVMNEFNVDLTTAFTVVRRFQKLIKKIRNE